MYTAADYVKAHDNVRKKSTYTLTEFQFWKQLKGNKNTLTKSCIKDRVKDSQVILRQVKYFSRNHVYLLDFNHLHPEDGGSMVLQNISIIPHHYTTQLGRPKLESPMLWKPQSSLQESLWTLLLITSISLLPLSLLTRFTTTIIIGICIHMGITVCN